MSCPLLSGQKVKTHTHTCTQLRHIFYTSFWTASGTNGWLAAYGDSMFIFSHGAWPRPPRPDSEAAEIVIRVIQTYNMETRPTEAICHFLMNSPHSRVHMLNVNSEYACHYFSLCFRDAAVCSCWPLRFPHSYLTWQWLTDLTALSREPLRTVATVTIPFLQAASTMETRIGLAWITLHCQERKQDEGEVNWIYQVSFYR